MSKVLGHLPSRAEFSDQVNTTFRITSSDGISFDAALTDLVDTSAAPNQENFSLIFRAPVDTPQNQNIYRLEHGALGSMDIFLVPIKRDVDRLCFEAVFNNFVQE